MSKAMAVLLLGLLLSAQVGCGGFWYEDDCCPRYFGGIVYFPEDYADCSGCDYFYYGDPYYWYGDWW